MIPPRSNEEIEARHIANNARTMEIMQHYLDKFFGDWRSKVTTRGQLSCFSDHQAHISMIEPKKFCEALEDPN